MTQAEGFVIDPMEGFIGDTFYQVGGIGGFLVLCGGLLCRFLVEGVVGGEV